MFCIMFKDPEFNTMNLESVDGNRKTKLIHDKEDPHREAMKGQYFSMHVGRHFSTCAAQRNARDELCKFTHEIDSSDISAIFMTPNKLFNPSPTKLLIKFHGPFCMTSCV